MVTRKLQTFTFFKQNISIEWNVQWSGAIERQLSWVNGSEVHNVSYCYSKHLDTQFWPCAIKDLHLGSWDIVFKTVDIENQWTLIKNCKLLSKMINSSIKIDNIIALTKSVLRFLDAKKDKKISRMNSVVSIGNIRTKTTTGNLKIIIFLKCARICFYWNHHWKPFLLALKKSASAFSFFCNSASASSFFSNPAPDFSLFLLIFSLRE